MAFAYTKGSDSYLKCTPILTSIIRLNTSSCKFSSSVTFSQLLARICTDILAHVTLFPSSQTTSRLFNVRPRFCLGTRISTPEEPQLTTLTPTAVASLLEAPPSQSAHHGRRDKSPQCEDSLKQVHRLLLLDPYVLPGYTLCLRKVEEGVDTSRKAAG